MSTALAYSIAGAVAATGLAKTHLTDAIRSGALKAHKSSQNEDGEPTGKYVILAADLERYLSALPEA